MNNQEQHREESLSIDEVAEKLYPSLDRNGNDIYHGGDKAYFEQEAFIAGANWQAKQQNAQDQEVKTLQEMHVEVAGKKDIEFLSKDEFSKYIVWSGCSQHCKGGQHVGRTCAYMIGEIKDLDLMARCGSHRSMIKNREIVTDCLYDMYLKS